MALIRNNQYGAKVEAVSGVEEALTAAEFAFNGSNYRVEDRPTEHERDLYRGDLAPDAALRGPRLRQFTGQVELAGGVLATAPAWDAPLRAAGFAQSTLGKTTINTVSGGTPAVGDLFGNNASQGSATILGRVAHLEDLGGGNFTLVYERVLADLVGTESITFYTSPTITASVTTAPSNAGRAYRPLSETDSAAPETMTAEVRENGQRLTIAGAAVTGRMSFRHGEPIMFDHEALGPAVNENVGGVWRARRAGKVTGIPAVGAPPVMGGQGFPFSIGGWSDVVAEDITVDLGNSLVTQPTLGANDVATSGYLRTRIGDREITIATSPEAPAVVTEDFRALLMEGGTFPLLLETGRYASLDNMIKLWAPRCQMRGSMQTDEREGRLLAPLDLRLVREDGGDGDDEIRIYHVFVGA